MKQKLFFLCLLVLLPAAAAMTYQTVSRGWAPMKTLPSKTVLFKSTFVAVSWDATEEDLSKLRALLDGYEVLQIRKRGEGFEAHVADLPEESKTETDCSGWVHALYREEGTLKLRETRSRFEGFPKAHFMADDMKIWSAFKEFACQTARAQGEKMTRSEKIFFVPGESFLLEGDRVVLKYFKGHFQSAPGHIRKKKTYAVVRIRGIEAAGGSAYPWIPEKAEKFIRQP